MRARIHEGGRPQELGNQRLLSCITDVRTDSDVFDDFKANGEKVEWDAMRGYSVSDPSFSRKWSEHYAVCLGFVILGTNSLGQNVSILGHTLPNMLDWSGFLSDLQKKVAQFQSMKLENVEVSIFGGGMKKNPKNQLEKYQRPTYIAGVDDLSQTLHTLTGIKPRVLAAPRVAPHGGHATSVGLDTETRRLWIFRDKPQLHREHPPFDAGQVTQVVASVLEGKKKAK